MLGKNLQLVRKDKKKTVEEMANVLNVTARTLGNYERETSRPDYEFIIKFVDTFKVNYCWLFTNIGEMYEQPKNTLEIKYSPLTIDYIAFGKRLNKIRVNVDMITREMSMLIEIKEDRFSDLCVGKVKPTLEEITKICENFEVTADWLLYGKE